MGWSITSYDSLRILYTNVYGESFIFKKSLTKFRILDQTNPYVEMFVDNDVYTWSPLPYGAGGIAGPAFARAVGIVGPYTQTLYYAEADTPSANNTQDLLDQLEQLLLSADVKVEKNGVFVGEREAINFIEGTDISILAVDNPTNDRVDVTISSSAEDPFPKILMLMGG